ncbi:ATP-binding protein [Amycolatopsis magusensis]|uniref:DNA-binding CsgD family transcriptional regulator n=2 Tax=Amycolatopsis magusensis TaxID=882444 RepID=A0ABS4Q026_9PSEU|nr:LuxR family transcriptional regulator [Amycolatopsis magusensis]MBP2185020.1 DNA-binding CsgD family transcriptional regulator [Amycolatopsis magusensis]
MLFERDAELALVGGALRAATAGESALILLRGPLGIGRSALLQRLPGLVTGSDARVLRANAAPMEQDFAFGVVRQLFDSLLAGTPEEAREHWMTERAGFAKLVFADDAMPPAEAHDVAQSEAVLHGLCTLLANVGEETPLLLLVDDLQWADVPSLRWFAYLARRLQGLRVVVVCTLRDGDPRAQHALVREVADAATRVLTPAPLSVEATKEVILGHFGEAADEEFACACHESSTGNPLFLNSMLFSLVATGCRPEAAQAQQLRTQRPSKLRERVESGLRNQPRPVRDLAAAIATFGEQGDPELIARLAGLDAIGFAGALRSLHQLGLLATEQEPRFFHRVVQDAVESSMTVVERERLHDSAAALLYRFGAPAEQVAAQLMAVTVSRQPWSVVVLRAAADTALRRGAPDTAARYLRRALLDSSTEGEDRARLLIDLATAERGFDPAACERHVSQAVPLLTTPRDRAAAVLRIAPTVLGAPPASMIDLIGQVATDLGSADTLDGSAREIALRLEARLRHAGHEDPAELASSSERLRGLGESPPMRSGAERELIVVLLHAATISARRPAAELASLANRILEREPATPSHVHTALPLLVLTLIAADSVQGISSWLSIERQARRQHVTVADALVHVEHSLVLTARGRLPEARDQAERAMQLVDADWHEVSACATVSLAAVALELRDIELSKRIVSGVGRRRSESLSLNAVSQILESAIDAHQGQWVSALDGLLTVGRLLEASGWRNSSLYPWRPWAISLHQRLGDHASALALAEEEHAWAESWGAASAVGRALRLQGWLHGGERGVELLRDAVGTLRGSANDLELARALVLLGRRLGESAEAAAALREGAELATACGASWLVERARPGTAGKPGAAPAPKATLTRTERRVAELAGTGLTNAEIADRLGVSSRAVEKHLTNSYRKLGVAGRAGLAGAISADVPDAS